MKLFKFRGGVHPEENKHLSADRPIRTLPLPARFQVPVQQHVGLPAVPIVKVGQAVLKGQLLARGQGAVSAPVHVPSSGTVVAIGDSPAPHASGLPVLTITIETDGEDRWIDSGDPPDPFELDPEDVALRVGAAGIVGMGGANFPTGVKLSKARQAKIHTLVINGAECEPYMTCDDRLMRERAEQIVDGIRIMLHALQAKHAMIAIEDNKPEAAAARAAACQGCPNMEVVTLPTRYPTGSAKQLTQLVTGLEVPAGGRGTDTGVLVNNVGTAHAVQQALRHGRPMVSRIVTVTGGAVPDPQNLEVPIGTPVAELLTFCGASLPDIARLLMGGPMMGQPLPSIHVPVVKGTNGILALTARELRPDISPSPCIRCGRCVDACPMSLMPLEIVKRAHHEDFQGALNFGLIDCLACGSCAYVCPSNIPLVQYIEFARGELEVQQRAEQKAKETRRLMEQRKARLTRQERASAEAATRRQADKKKAREQADAGV